METSTERVDGHGPVDGRSDSPKEVSSLVDWGISAVLTVIGLMLAAVAWLLFTRVDRPAIQDAVESETVTVEGLSRADVVDIAVPLVDWLAIGLGATATVLVVGGVGFAVVRRQTHKRAARTGETTGTPLAHATYGTAAAALLSFVPFSTALGGALAGYLRNGTPPSGAKVGALSGLLGTVPMAVLTAGVVVGGASGAAAIGEGGLGTLVAILGAIVVLILALINAGLGALGGALVDRF